MTKKDKKKKKNFIILKLFVFILTLIFFIFFGKNKICFFQELKNFKSYSQVLEDLILFAIFYNVKNGFYIDVGANNPNDISVTKAFYIRGWKGINIEPLPNQYLNLIKYRDRDINLNIGVGKNESYASLLNLGTGSLITNNKSLIEENPKNILNITVNTLKNICKTYIPKKQNIDFLKIDVEGGERDVLLGCDFDNYRPKVFCIESTIPATSIPCYDLWENILLENDYSFVYQYSINRFYIDNRITYLKERFDLVKKAIKYYTRKYL